MNGTSRPPTSPILPLPDSARVDWTNLVDAARAFEGKGYIGDTLREQKGYRWAAVLNETESAQKQWTYHF